MSINLIFYGKIQCTTVSLEFEIEFHAIISFAARARPTTGDQRRAHAIGAVDGFAKTDSVGAGQIPHGLPVNIHAHGVGVKRVVLFHHQAGPLLHMHARVGFATGQVIQCVLVGGLAHNIEGVGSRAGEGVTFRCAFNNKVDSHADNDEPDHKVFPHEESVTVREGGGKAMVFWEIGGPWLKNCEVGHGYGGWGIACYSPKILKKTPPSSFSW